MVKEKKHSPEKEIEKLCEKNKISIDLTGYNKIKGLGKLKLLHDGLLKFIEKQKAEDVLLIEGVSVKVKISNREFDVEREGIIDLLNQEELIIQYLDLGEVDGKWYFGFKLGNQDAIIMDSSKIYRNTEQRFKGEITGENQIKKLFDYDGYIGNIAPTIAKETIKRYYTKSQRNHLIRPKEIYKTIREKILYYMDFSGKDEIADVLTCWIIATYCYPLFFWFPHILINAPTQSGKSKCAFIIIQLSFRGFDLGASAGVLPAQIYRTLEGNRGTFLIDEFEQTKGRSYSSETQQLVNQVLNVSPSRDAYIIRNEQIDKKWVAKKFPIFCPKIACNISGINPTSLSRYIAFSWLKTKTKKGKRKPQREREKKSFVPLREDLYLLILENWKEIKKIYDSLDITLSNREEDNWLPLFAIARFIDGSGGVEEEIKVNAEEQLKKYLESYKELQIETGDNTEDFFRILYDKVGEEKKYYTPKEIGGWDEIQDLFSYLKSPAHKIGSVLKSYKFLSNRGGGRKKYLLSKKSIKDIIDLYFNIDIIPHNNTNNTKSHKQHIKTQTTLKKENGNVGLSGINSVTQKTQEKENKKISKGNVGLGGICGITREGSVNQIPIIKIKSAKDSKQKKKKKKGVKNGK